MIASAHPHSPPPEATMLTVDDVAAALQCSTRHVYRLEVDGRIPRATRLGALVRWRRDVIDAWLAAGCPAQEEGET